MLASSRALLAAAASCLLLVRADAMTEPFSYTISYEMSFEIFPSPDADCEAPDIYELPDTARESSPSEEGSVTSVGHFVRTKYNLACSQSPCFTGAQCVKLPTLESYVGDIYVHARACYLGANPEEHPPLGYDMVNGLDEFAMTLYSDAGCTVELDTQEAAVGACLNGMVALAGCETKRNHWEPDAKPCFSSEATACRVREASTRPADAYAQCFDGVPGAATAAVSCASAKTGTTSPTS